MNQINLTECERYVEDLLTVSGVCKDGGEQRVWLLLHHLYSAVAMYELMTDEEKTLIAGMQKKLRYFFSSRCELKKRKEKKAKENFPPNPLLKEKEKKEKAEENIFFVQRENQSVSGRRLKGHSRLTATLIDRREDFRQQCLQFLNRYDNQRLADFFNYWSEENKDTGKMRFEEQKHWNLNRRLPRWMSNQFSADNVAAAIRLKRTRKKLAKDETEQEAQRVQAMLREADNQRRELEMEASRKGKVSTEEYVRQHPDSVMARLYRERQAKEAAKATSRAPGEETNMKGGAP